MAREAKLIIRLSEEAKESFQTLADEMGMTMSSLGSFVIGNFMREEKLKRAMQNKMIEQLSPQLTEAIKDVDLNDPRIAKVVADTFNKIAQNNSQQ